VEGILTKMETLNKGQLEIATDLLSKIDNVIKTNSQNLEDRIFSLTGAAGTGKSYLTSVLLGELKKRVGKLCLTATTHRALAVVKNIGASHNIESRTIHSYLKCKLKENTHTGTVDLIRDENKAIDLVDILIVDESSLLSASLFNIIQEEMLKNTIRICIFVGDSAQLLPVEESDNNPIYEGLIECNEYALTEITRQAADSSIIQLATYIRKQIEAQDYKPFSDLEQFILNMNSPEIQVVRKINDFYDEYAKVPFKDSIILAHKNVTVNMYNKKARTLEYGKNVSILEGERLVFNSAHTNGEETVHYNNQEVVVKSCELIIDEANDIEYWKVITTEDTLFKVVDYSYKVEFEEKLKEIAKEAKKAQGTTKTMLWERYFSLKNTFQDVVYTYASSIYKSQGGSIDCVFVDFNELTGMVRFLSLDDLYRLSYIFVTRAKQKLTIFIK
jgi:exodeoxyribonuclease-5